MFVANAVVFAIASVAIAAHVDWAALTGSFIGASISLLVLMVPFDTATKPAHRRPQPWPTGAVAAPRSRVVRAAVATLATLDLVVAVVLLVAFGSEVLPFFAVTAIYGSLGGFASWRRFARLQRTLGVTLYREPNRPWPPRLVFRPQIFALVDHPSPSAAPDRTGRVPTGPA